MWHKHTNMARIIHSVLKTIYIHDNIDWLSKWSVFLTGTSHVQEPYDRTNVLTEMDAQMCKILAYLP